MRMLKAAALGAAIWVSGSGMGPAEAATFQLVDVKFTDNGTATGQFYFDAVNGFTKVNITTSSTASFGGAIYTADDPSGIQAGIYSSTSGDNFISLLFERVCLSIAVQSCPVAFASGEYISSGGEFRDSRFVTSGSAAPIPLPAPLLLFATGLAGVVGFSRAKRRKQQMAQG